MARQRRGNPVDYVTVEIYDQLYHIAGNDAEHIRKLAESVDAKMRAIARNSSTADSLRVAVLAALNLADELSRAIRPTTPIPGSSPATSSSPTTGGSILLRPGHARAASLHGLLNEVLDEERKQEKK